MSTPETNAPAAEPREPSGWWRAPGGGREVLAIAAPMVVSSLSWTVMTFVDRMMLNHWSGAAMSAAFVGGVFWWAIVCLPLGVCSYVGTFVAQYHGAGRPGRIGPAVWQGVWISLVATPLVLLPIPLALSGAFAAGRSPEAAELEASYLAILCAGSPAMLLSAALSCFWSGRGKTIVVMVVDAIFAGLNLLLDWWWIFGLTLTLGGSEVELFAPAGVAGAAWATTVSLWLKTGLYLVLMLLRHNRRTYRSYRWRPDRPLLGRVLRFGTPAGVQMLLDVTGFTVFILMVTKLGEVAGEATSMAFSVGHLAFMPIVGFGTAASILVGQHLGENRDRAAAKATWTSLQISLGYMLLISAAFVLTPGWFLSGFFVGEAIQGDPSHRGQVAATAVVLLRFIAGYNLLDAMAIVFGSALKGAGDTRFILVASLLLGASLSVLSWLAVEQWEFGLYACWGLIAGWIGVMGLTFLLRFLQGSWRAMRVIEPEV